VCVCVCARACINACAYEHNFLLYCEKCWSLTYNIDVRRYTNIHNSLTLFKKKHYFPVILNISQIWERSAIKSRYVTFMYFMLIKNAGFLFVYYYQWELRKKKQCCIKLAYCHEVSILKLNLTYYNQLMLVVTSVSNKYHSALGIYSIV
jgi:hypothetical protein